MRSNAIRKVWDVALKDLRHLSKDRTALLMMFAVPLLLMGLLGAAFSGPLNSSTVKVTLPVIDRDGGSSARALIAAIRHTPSVTVKLRTDEASVKKSVRDGDEVAALIIPAGFSQRLAAHRPRVQVTYYTVANNTN